MNQLQPRNFVARPWMLAALLLGCVAHAAGSPVVTEGYHTLRNFRFSNGQAMGELRIHYRTIGTPQKDEAGVVRNAVLIGHGTGSTGAQCLRPEFAGELFGAGHLLDATRYYIVMPDGIGHGKSSKPSDGLRAQFPRYGYTDMVEAQYRLLTEGLGVNHLRLVLGTAMGGMHAWVWGERHPGFMDALMPLASVPWQVSGRNRVWRKTIEEAIRNDPAWNGGNYDTQPPSLRTAAALVFFMVGNSTMSQEQMPSLASADEQLEQVMAKAMRDLDANDVLYQISASWDYDPAPGLERIRTPLLAVNSADDLVNPPELGILEREIKRVKYGKAVIVPLSRETRGHGTHTMAAVWKRYLAELLHRTQ